MWKSQHVTLISFDEDEVCQLNLKWRKLAGEICLQVYSLFFACVLMVQMKEQRREEKMSKTIFRSFVPRVCMLFGVRKTQKGKKQTEGKR